MIQTPPKKASPNMLPKAKIPQFKEGRESLMHKLAKEKLAEWLLTEKNTVVVEYPIVRDYCGSTNGWVSQLPGITKQIQGWSLGPTYETLVNTIIPKLVKFDDSPLYPVAICDVFTYNPSEKCPEANEIWEIYHTNGVTPEKLKAILDCYRHSGNLPHFFEVDASVILGFDANIKPKDALRKLRLTTKDLNPHAQFTEKQWLLQFKQEDEDEHQKRFIESDEYKQRSLDISSRRKAMKEELDTAVKVLDIDAFIGKLFDPLMMCRYHEKYEKEKTKCDSELTAIMTTPTEFKSFSVSHPPRLGEGELDPFLRSLLTKCTHLRINATPIEWAKDILKGHIDSMIQVPDPGFKDFRQAWMENHPL